MLEQDYSAIEISSQIVYRGLLDSLPMSTITLPSGMPGFVQSSSLPEEDYITINRGTSTKMRLEKVPVLTSCGSLCDLLCKAFDWEFRTCPKCGHQMHAHTSTQVTLTHAPTHLGFTKVEAECKRRRCPHCRTVVQQPIPFKHDKHRITTLAAKHVLLSMRRTHRCKATWLVEIPL